jgi:peptide/nickel transport system substrate-binding protein
MVGQCGLRVSSSLRALAALWTLSLVLAACAPASPPAAGATPGGATTVAPSTTQNGAAAGTPQKGGTLVVAFNADPETFDPHVTTALFATRAFALVYNTLLERDYDGSYKPGLATSWDVGPDGTVYTFHLRTGVKFHSGKAFSSSDVKYTFERWLSIPTSPTSFGIKPIDHIDAPDPQTVVFTLKQPYNIFLDQIAGSYAVILNQESVDKAGKDYGISTVDGTGPFKFVSWTRNQEINFVRNDDYTWNSSMFTNPGPAYVDGVKIRIIPEDNTRVAEFQAGNVHLVQDVPQGDVDRLDKTQGVSIVRYDQLQTTYVGLNSAKPPFDDVKVRQAVALAINRDEIVTGANFGLAKPATTMLTPETPYFLESSLQTAPSFDLAKAGSLLDQAGWTMGSGGVRQKGGQQLVMPLWVINDSTTVLQAQILEQQLAKVGIKVDTKQYEQTAWFAAARSGEQTAFIIGIFFESADGILYFYFYSKQQPAPNRFTYANPQVDQWLDDARINTDKNVVTQDYQNVQKQIIDDVPVAPLVHAVGTLGVVAGVQGVKVHPSRWLYRMTDIWLSGPAKK